jgi:hypothetical protein
MIKRIEFTLNLDDPHEAALYRALKPSLRYRRAGATIREALQAYLQPGGEAPQTVHPTLKKDLT